MLETFRRLFRNQSGATPIEYALIASLIVVFLITAVQTVGPTASAVFGDIGGALK